VLSREISRSHLRTTLALQAHPPLDRTGDILLSDLEIFTLGTLLNHPLAYLM